MAIRSYTRSFNGGEVAPAMFARIDDAKYQTGLAKCKNFLIEPQGPLVNRPGFEYVRETKYANKKTKLIPFSFSDTQTMVLEFGDKYIRFHTNGATLLKDDGSVYEISTPYGEDDLFDIHYVQSADILTLVHPSHAPRELRRYSALDWRLVEIKFGSNLAAPNNVRAVQTINGEVTSKEDYTREYAVTALLADGSQESIRSTSASVKCNPYGDGAYNTISWDAVSCAGLYRVYRNQGGIWAYIGQTGDTKIVDENIDPDASITPPLYDDAFNQTNGISSVTISNAGAGYMDATTTITSQDLPNAKVSSRWWDGSSGKWKYDYQDKPYKDLSFPINASRTVAYAYDFSCEVVDEGGSGKGATIEPILRSEPDGKWVTWYLDGFEITNTGSGYVNPVAYCYMNNNASGKTDWIMKFVIPLSMRHDAIKHEVRATDSTGTGFDAYALSTNGKITQVVIRNPGTGYTSPTLSIASSATTKATLETSVKAVGDYPGAVSYFEQRRWFGGTYNRPNNLWATKSGTESVMSYSLPTQDTDRISVRVAARESSRIQHIVPLAHLMLLTGSAEWRVSPLNDDAITPSSMSVRPQSYVGASNVQPLVVNNTMIYVASRGGHLRECGYNYQAGGFVSNDICLRAPHLFDNLDVVDMAFAKAPWPIAWAVSTNGSLIALTYVPEQQVGAFSTVETKGAFKACCVVAESDEDILYCVVERTINGVTKQFVERMHERQFKSLDDSNYMDCSAVYKGEAKAEISGLTWLEGEEVAVLADGSVEPNQVVKNGKISLQFPASVVRVGIPYECDVKTLPVAMALQDGSFGSGHKKNVRKVFFRTVNSSGLKSGPSFDSLTTYAPRTTELAGNPPNPITDEFGFVISAAWSNGGQVCVRQDLPLPMRIVSMTVDLEMA